MFSITHPLRNIVYKEYCILSSLISDIPNYYNNMINKIELEAKEIANSVSEGDLEVFMSIYNSYTSPSSDIEEITEHSRSYILIAIYAFYERNIRNIYKELGFKDYNKKNIDINTVFQNVNLEKDSCFDFYKELQVFGLLRNNLSHGKLNNDKNWNIVLEYIDKNKSLSIEDDVVCILDNDFLDEKLELVYDFFKLIFDHKKDIFYSKRI